jgi:hypothetical protein
MIRNGGRSSATAEWPPTERRVSYSKTNPQQSLQDPLCKRGPELHNWFVGTKSFKAMFGIEGGLEGVDNDFAHRSMDGFGAFILG